tara:strand:+ start:159 stop:659 length:501 start_codon:yes stop_codon:yes gene_type:complete
MAHFAKLDENNIVTQVVVVKNNQCLDSEGNESESHGQSFLQNLYGEPNSIWKQCSYNTVHGLHTDGGTAFRGNFPTVGYVYDATLDVFYTAKEHVSWTLHTEDATGLFNKYEWKPPVAAPTTHENDSGVMYDVEWDEANKRWTAYLIDDNETQYVWNTSNSTWDTL